MSATLTRALAKIPAVAQDTGTSTTSVMSQDAVTDQLNALGLQLLSAANAGKVLMVAPGGGAVSTIYAVSEAAEGGTIAVRDANGSITINDFISTGVEA